MSEQRAPTCSDCSSATRRLRRIAAGEHDLFPDFEILLRDHIDKEDNSLFPAAAIWLGGDEWVEVNALTHDHDHASGTPHQHAH